MGKIKQGILGGFSGKVGNVVGSSWKGIAVMKALPLSVANPKTAGQVIQRSKFKGAILLGSTVLNSTIKPLFNAVAQRQSGYNLFVSNNVDNFTDNGFPDLTLLNFSPDTEPESLKAKLEDVGADVEIKIVWDPNDGSGNALPSDNAYAVLVGLGGEVFGTYSAAGAKRVDGQLLMSTSKRILPLLNPHVYLIFKSEDNKRVFGQDNSTEWV